MSLLRNRCQHWLRQHPAIASAGVGALIAVVLLTHFATKYGLNSPPSATGDEPSYDSIGWQLSRGMGFGEDFSDPKFRRPYDQASLHDPGLMTLPDLPSGIVTYRPPLFPGLIAVTNLLFGRQFLMIRCLNVICIATVGGILWGFLARRSGLSCALISLGLFLVVDVRTRLYARAILTESLAALLTTLLTLLMLRLLQSRRLQDAGLMGLVGGLLMLNRTAFVLWLPGLSLGMLCLLSSRPQPLAVETGGTTTNQSARQRIRRGVLLTIFAGVVTTAVYLPWGIRNCQVLGRFMPLGTQGLMELSAAFSDRAWQDGGVWFQLDQEDFFRELNVTDTTRLESEILRADFSRDQAIRWLSQHPGKAVLLGAMKIYHEYRPRSPAEWILCLAAVAGLTVSWKSPDTRVFLLIHATNATAIAVTWSVEGRFVMPLLFSTHVLAAIGIHSVFRFLGTTTLLRLRSFSRSSDQPAE